MVLTVGQGSASGDSCISTLMVRRPPGCAGVAGESAAGRPGVRSGYGNRTGWRAVFDLDAWIRALLVVTVGVVLLSALACGVALVRDTTGHDWYATGKLTITELLIGIGFDDSAPTQYRNWRDEVLSLTRDELRNNADALFARRHVLRTARKAAELGACCGFGGALLCLALFRRQDRRPTRHTAPEPATAAAVPVREPPVRSPDSRTQGAGARDSGKGAGKSDVRSTARRTRRKRHYGRWI